MYSSYISVFSPKHQKRKRKKSANKLFHMHFLLRSSTPSYYSSILNPNHNVYRVTGYLVTCSKIYHLLLIHLLPSFFQEEATRKVSIYHNNLALNFSSWQTPGGRMTLCLKKHRAVRRYGSYFLSEISLEAQMAQIYIS